MKVIFFMVTVSMLPGITACNGDGFIKTGTGLQYKIIFSGRGPVAQPGQYLKLEVLQQYEDTVLINTRAGMPQYQALDTVSLSPEAFEIFKQVHKGDSLVFRYLSDSAFKENMPPFAEKGKWLYTYVKVENIFSEQDSVRLDYEKEAQQRN